jgi:hypothetical protein
MKIRLKCSISSWETPQLQVLPGGAAGQVAAGPPAGCAARVRDGRERRAYVFIIDAVLRQEQAQLVLCARLCAG